MKARKPSKIFAQRWISKMRRSATIQVSINWNGRVVMIGDVWAQNRFIDVCKDQGWQMNITHTGRCG